MMDAGDGAQVLARNIIPKKVTTDENFPLLFWIHGGSELSWYLAGSSTAERNPIRSGWAAGDVELDDSYLKIACVKLRISIINCEYRYECKSLTSIPYVDKTSSLAPEYPFPTGLNDCYSALKYVWSWLVQSYMKCLHLNFPGCYQSRTILSVFKKGLYYRWCIGWRQLERSPFTAHKRWSILQGQSLDRAGADDPACYSSRCVSWTFWRVST